MQMQLKVLAIYHEYEFVVFSIYVFTYVNFFDNRRKNEHSE